MSSPGREALAEAARQEAALVYGTTYPGRRAYDAEPRAARGPAELHDIAALVDALNPRDRSPRLAHRVSIESSRALGFDEIQTASRLHVPLDDVRAVWAAMDRVAG